MSYTRLLSDLQGLVTMKVPAIRIVCPGVKGIKRQDIIKNALMMLHPNVALESIPLSLVNIGQEVPSVLLSLLGLTEAPKPTAPDNIPAFQPSPEKEITMEQFTKVVIVNKTKRILWHQRWAHKDAEMSVLGYKEHLRMNEVICPRGIPIYDPTKDLYLHAFEGMKVVTYPLFQFIREESDGSYSKFPMRLNLSQKELYIRALKELVLSPKVVGLTVSENSLKLIIDEQKRGWLWWLTEKGITLPGGDKGMKRARPHLSSHSLVATFNHLSMKVLDHEDKALFDGPCTVSKEFIKKCLRLMESKLSPSTIRSYLKTKKVILRVDVPGGGMIKALAYVVKSQREDIITHSENIKKEVGNSSSQWNVMMDIKRSHRIAHTNTMCGDNFRDSLFTYGHLKAFFDSQIQKDLLKIRDQGYLEFPESELTGEELEEDIFNSIYLKRKNAAQALMQAGLNLHYSKTTLEQAYMAKIRKILDDTRLDKITIEIPCARYVPIVPKSFALTLRSKVDLQFLRLGEIAYLSDYDLCVVSDSDWVNNMVNHGGNDGDDDFYVLYRTDAKTQEKKVIVYRMPNDKGEWAMYTPYSEKDCPVSEVSSNYELKNVTWIKCSLDTLPPQISTLNREYCSIPKSPSEHTTFSREFALEQVSRVLNGVSAGATMNTVMLMNHVNYVPNVPLLPMEKIIDTATQSSSSEEMSLIMDKYATILQDIAKSGTKVDWTFAQRFLFTLDKDFRPLILQTHKGWITRLREYVVSVIGYQDQNTNRWVHPPQGAMAWIKENVELKMPTTLQTTLLTDEQRSRVERLFQYLNNISREGRDSGLGFDEKKAKLLQVLTTNFKDFETEALRYFAHLTHTTPTTTRPTPGTTWTPNRTNYERYRSDWLFSSNPNGVKDNGTWEKYLKVLARPITDDMDATDNDIVEPVF